MSRVLRALCVWVVAAAVLVAAGGCGRVCRCAGDRDEPVPGARGVRELASGPVSGPVVVMSFNIRLGCFDDGEDSWRYRREMVFDVLHESGAQIVGLQEACRGQINEIRERFGYFGEVGLSIDDGGKRGEHTPILYDERRFEAAESGTFWLSGRPDEPGSNTWGAADPRVCSWVKLIEEETGRAVWVFNTHFDHIWEKVRENSARLVGSRMAQLAGSDPAILMGDLNSGEGTRTIDYIKGRRPIWWEWTMLPMVDSFRVVHPSRERSETFHGFSGGERIGKLDYVFVTDDVEVMGGEIVTYSVDGRYPSDHFPVTATISF